MSEANSKRRDDSYEESLSDEHREQLYAVCSQQGLSLAAMRKLCPAWGRGPREGAQPSVRCVSEIAARLRREEMLLQVDATAKLMEAVRKKVGAVKSELQSGDSIEQTLDVVCDLVGQEVLQKTVEGQDLKTRNTALQRLLKRADQKRFDKKFNRETIRLFLEWFEDKRATQIASSSASTADKTEELGKHIFGELWE